MLDYITTQEDIDILLQTNKRIKYRIELLNENLKIVDSLEANIISDNISINADSDIRRTYTCNIVVTDSTFTIGKDTKIWFNKRIRPFVGIISERSKETVWYCLGTYLFTDANYSYNATTKELSLTCLDLMCTLNDKRGGQLDQYQRKIKADTDVRSIIIGLLSEVNITNYFIEFSINGKIHYSFKLPYDKTYQAGTTVYQILSDLISLYPGTQMYFDLYGRFNIRRIPTKHEDLNILTDDILDEIVISEELSTSMSNFYNYVKIFGNVNEPNLYSTSVDINGNCYDVTIIEDLNTDKPSWDYERYIHGDKIAVKIPVPNLPGALINVNGLGAIPIVHDDGTPINAGELKYNTDYVFRYKDIDTPSFLLLGQYQCYGECYLTNNIHDTNQYAVISPDSDYSIEKIGVLQKVLSGGEFDNIYTDGLCQDRCKYELYNMANRHDSLTLNTIAIPYLDVNDKILYTTKSTNETNEFIVNSIQCDYSTYTMTIQLNRFYPEYLKQE